MINVFYSPGQELNVNPWTTLAEDYKVTLGNVFDQK